MKVYINEKELVIMAEPKAIRFNLTKNVENSLKHEIDHMIKRREILAQDLIKKLD